MIRTFFAVGMMFSLVSVIEAQEVNPPVAPQPIPRAAPPGPSGGGVVDLNGKVSRGLIELSGVVDVNGKVSYMIEFKVLEGNGVLTADAAWTDFTTRVRFAPLPALPPATPRAGDQGVSNATPVPPSTQPAAPAPAVATTQIFANPPITAKNSEADQLSEVHAIWDSLGTTVAVPRIVTLAKQSATFQIQTSHILSYLVPLGDGKYQAKHSPVQALGMKITFAVQPVDGDDTSVELSPLEIEITALDGREPVEGLDLDVGKPIISTRSLKTTAKVKLGATRLIAIPSGPKTQAALLLRVKRAGSEFVAPPPRQLNEPQNK